MADIVIIQKSNDAIVSSYQDSAPNQQAYGGPWGDPNKTAHVQVPNDKDLDIIKAVWVPESGSVEDGDYVAAHYELQDDPDKVQIVRNRKLETLRRQRDKELEKADTQLYKHSDGDPNAVATESEWRSYRTSLRSLTDSYKDSQDESKGTSSLDQYAKDMSDFDGWPTKPS